LQRKKKKPKNKLIALHAVVEQNVEELFNSIAKKKKKKKNIRHN
jgi:hypothetical protein